MKDLKYQMIIIPDDYYEFWHEFLECIRNVIWYHQKENRQRFLLVNTIDILKYMPFSTPLNPIVRITLNNKNKLSVDYV